jgi:hypothetical protein
MMILIRKFPPKMVKFVFEIHLSARPITRIGRNSPRVLVSGGHRPKRRKMSKKSTKHVRHLLILFADF